MPSAVTAENLSVPEQVKAVIKLKSVPSAATVSTDAPFPFKTPVREEKTGAFVKTPVPPVTVNPFEEEMLLNKAPPLNVEVAVVVETFKTFI